MKKLLSQHKWLLTLLLFVFASIVSIYLTDLANGHIWSYLGLDTDGRFHIMRMEGLYQSMKEGVLFPVVNMSFLGGFGYISNVFYSNLWLYPAAILRFAGFSIAQSFVIYYVMLNFCTFLTSFFAYYRASHQYNKSLIFSFVYTLGAYSIFDMVRRFDVGEVLTLVFLPIVMLGIYEIFYADDKKWLYLTVGMVAIIYSHALSPILIAIFIVLVILFRLRTLIRQPRRILKLFYAGGTSLILSLAYFLPIIEQLKHTQFKLTSPLVDVVQRSSTLPELFSWSLTNNVNQQGIGLILILVAVMIPLVIWKVKTPVIRDFAIIGEILLIMTTNIFPWKFFENTPLKMIQFPWRFNMIITILFAIFLASDPLKLFNRNWKRISLIVMTMLVTVVSEAALIKNNPNEYNSYASFDNVDTYSIGIGEEYLPKNANLTELRSTSHKPEVKSGSAIISDFKQVGSKVSFQYQDAKNAKVDLPIIGYYGYSSKSSIGKVSQLKMDQKNNGLGTVTIHGNGAVKVNYYPTMIQQLSKLVSLMGLLVVSFIFVIRKKE